MEAVGRRAKGLKVSAFYNSCILQAMARRELRVLAGDLSHSWQDLGRLLGVSAATINARLTQARQMLRERLMRCR